MFLCPGCGADIRFSPEKQKLVCDFCDSEYTTKEFNEKRAIAAEDQPDSTYAATLFTCPQCGGELLTEDDTAATFCSYCGSSVMLEARIVERMKPDYVIPFKVNREDCEAAYKRLIKKATYLPKDMRDESHISQFRAIYMPYWSYEYMADNFKITTSKTKTKGDYYITDRYRLDAKCKGKISGIHYDASSTFSDALSGAIAPFDVSEQKEFSPAYLSGFYADTNDVESAVYQDEAAKAAELYLTDEVYKDKTFEKHDIGYSEVKDINKCTPLPPKLGFMPVWFLATQTKDKSKVSYAVVNGQTGKAAADLPVDFGKYLWTSLLLAIPLFAVLCLLFTFTPIRAVQISMVLAVIGIFAAIRDAGRIRARKEGTDDRGKASVQPTDTIPDPSESVPESHRGAKGTGRGKKKAKGKSKDRYKGNTKKPLIGFILGVLLLAGNPPQDILFYGVSGVISILVAWTFFELVKDSNLLTTRKPPQLGRRGGEENV